MKLRLSRELNELWQRAADIMRMSKAEYLRRAVRSFLRQNVAGLQFSKPATGDTVVTVDDYEGEPYVCRQALTWATVQTIKSAPPPVAIAPEDEGKPYEIVEVMT